MKITVTHHDEGRSFRTTTRERFIGFAQALNIHDPFFYATDSDGRYAYPCWMRGSRG